jgi:hypothetical protein
MLEAMEKVLTARRAIKVGPVDVKRSIEQLEEACTIFIDSKIEEAEAYLDDFFKLAKRVMWLGFTTEQHEKLLGLFMKMETGIEDARIGLNDTNEEKNNNELMSKIRYEIKEKIERYGAVAETIKEDISDLSERVQILSEDIIEIKKEGYPTGERKEE